MAIHTYNNNRIQGCNTGPKVLLIIVKSVEVRDAWRDVIHKWMSVTLTRLVTPAETLLAKPVMVLETLHRPAQSIESADLWVEPDKAFPKIAEPIPCKVEKAKGRGVGWILAILMTLINIQEAMATSTTMASTHRQLSLIQGVVYQVVLIRIVQLWTDFHYRTIICLILRRTMRISLMISTISEIQITSLSDDPRLLQKEIT